jgi:hypothetical protein
MYKETSKSLAAIIISNRILGLYSEKAKSCMSELLRRREDDGDLFEYEKYIEDQIQIIEDKNELSRANNGLFNMISSVGKMI